MFSNTSHAYFLFLFDHTARFFTLSTLNSFSSQRKKTHQRQRTPSPSTFEELLIQQGFPSRQFCSSRPTPAPVATTKHSACSTPEDTSHFQLAPRSGSSEPLRKVTPHNHQRVSGAIHFPASFRRTTTQHGTARTTEEATDDGRSVSNVTCCVLERGHTTRVIGK